MPICEWKEVDCPPSIFKDCPIWPQSEKFLAELKEIPNGSREYLETEDKLRGLCHLRCPLEEKLLSSMDLEDLTAAQLASVGATKIPHSQFSTPKN